MKIPTGIAPQRGRPCAKRERSIEPRGTQGKFRWLQRTGMRPSSTCNQGHVALEHIKELGQLIDARPAEEVAYARRAKIAPARLSYGSPVLESRHRPELEDHELLRVESGSPLLEDDWTAAIELYG